MKKILAVILFLTILLTACVKQAPQEAELFAMDTLMQLRIWGGENDLSAIKGEIVRLDTLLSATGPDSALAMLNKNGRADLTPELNELIQSALALSEQTGGAFDPTVYPLVCAWGFPEKSYHVPEKAERTSLLQYVGTQHLHINGTSLTMDAGTQLDFGAIAKGYTAQHCIEILKEHGVQAALLSLGGNVQTLGSKPDGSEWIIGITNPENPSQAVACLRFSGSMAVVTSGSYQRYFEQDGKRYHHIIDPKTGMPADSGLCSVTVLAQDGATADALSTALFVMGLERGTDFWRENDDFEAVFIVADGKIYATEGAATMLNDCSFTEIKR